MQPINDNVNHSASSENPDVLDLVHQVMHQYRSLQYQRLKVGAHGITHMDVKVLGFFVRHPRATQSDLAQHSGRDKAQLARLIKGLRDQGLLVAQVDDSDRRNVRLSLSIAGELLQRTLHQQAKALASQALKGLSASERRQLFELLDRLRMNWGPESSPG